VQRFTCYACSALATSREHAPPRCLFPEARDTVDGQNLRKNLITVPACDEHNSEKSHDDEYLFFALAGSYTSSGIGLQQFTTKVRRAFAKRPTKATNFVRRSAPVQLRRTEHDEWEHGAQILVDGERLDHVLSNTARALYFHHRQQKFQGTAEVLTNFTVYLNDRMQANVSKAFDMSARELAFEVAHGANPKVFNYKFVETSSTTLFYFSFYGSSSALVRFKKIIVAR
jgi:hypothetical protein